MTAPAPEPSQTAAILARAERAATRLQLAIAGQLPLDLDDAARLIDGNRALRRTITNPTPPTIQYGERAR